MVQPISPLIAELQKIQALPEWANTSATARLDWMTQYEQKLFDKAQAKYPGGWEKYLSENPMSAKFLEDTKKEQFTMAQDDIHNRANSFVRSTLNGGAESITESFFRHTSAGINYSLGALATMAGMPEEAEALESRGDAIRAKWRVGINRLAEVVNDKDKNGLPVANEMYAFAQGFLPFLQVDDKEIFQKIAEREGLLNADGTAKALTTEGIITAMGDFARTMVMMRVMPFVGNGKLAYNAKYAVATGISAALNTPVAQGPMRQMLISSGSSFVALGAGTLVSNWAMRNPLMAKFLGKLPARVQEFAAGRAADVGESFSNAVELAVRTGDPWSVIQNFPVALTVNMMEEMAVDLVGGGLFAGKSNVIQSAMYQVRSFEAGARKKAASLEEAYARETDAGKKEKIAKDISSLNEVADMYNGLYQKRAEQLSKAIKSDPRIAEKLAADGNQTYAAVYTAAIEQGMPHEEAMEAAASTAIQRDITAEAIEDNLGVKANFKRFINNIGKDISKDKSVAEQPVAAKPVDDFAMETHYTEKPPNVRQEAVDALNDWVRELPPHVQNWVSINRVGKIIVDPIAYEKAYQKPYAGEKALGKTRIINRTALFEIVSGAPIEVAHHEIFHFAQRAALTNEQLEVMSKYGNFEEQARAYSEWVMRGKQTDTAVGKIFKSISDFFEGLKNFLFGRGFTTAEQIFEDVHAANITVTLDHQHALDEYYQGTVHKGFITPEGLKHGMLDLRKEFPDAAKNNWVRKDVDYRNNPLYKVMKFDNEVEKLIEGDLKAYTEQDEDRNVTIDTPTNKWIINLNTFRERQSLRGAMRQAVWMEEKPVGKFTQDEYYAVEEDPVVTAHNDVVKNGSWNIKDQLKRLPFLKEIFHKYTKDHKDMSRIATLLEMPFYAAQNWKPVQDVIDAQNKRDRDLSRRFYGYIQNLQPVNDLDSVSAKKVYRVIADGDVEGKTYSTEELAAKGLTGKEVPAYCAVRKVLDDVLRSEIAELKAVGLDIIGRFKKIAEKRLNGKSNKDEALKLIDHIFSNNQIDAKIATDLLVEAKLTEFVNLLPPRLDRVHELDTTIRNMEEKIGKGYFPHNWFGKHGLVFWVQTDQRTPEMMTALGQVSKLSSDKDGFWYNTVKNQGETAHHVRLHFAKYGDFVAAEKVLKQAGHKYETEKVGRFDTVDHNIKMETKAVNRRLIESAQQYDKDGKAVEDISAVDAAFDLIDDQLKLMDRQYTWRIHQQYRAGTLGYEVDNMKEVLSGYLSGYAGMATKRTFALEAAAIVGDINQGEQPRLAKYTADMVESLLRSQDEIDKWTNVATSIVFSKYLAFNPAFHMRNIMQPLYLGVPTMESHGIKSGTAMKEIGRAYYLAKSLAHYYRGANENEAKAFVDKLPEMEAELAQALARMFDEGHGGSIRQELFDQVQNVEKGNPYLGKMGRAFAWYMQKAGDSVQFTDTMNRVVVFAATYRALTKGKNLTAGTMDEGAYKTAIAVTNESNVVYKSWNTLPIFFGEKVKIIKPLFTFQRYGWATTRLQWKWICTGQFGPLLQYWGITALLGGAETLPIWAMIATMIGADDAPKVRKKMIEYLGGEKELFKMLETGLLGMAGIDVRMSLAIRPLSPFVDPLMGESVIMGLGREIKATLDDVKRQRLYKAMFENALVPNAVKRVAKAIRESTLEGKTTYLGDTVLDFNGNPIKLSVGEAMISSLGFVPVRIGRYYSAVMGIKEFQEYWSKEKSEIGTMYKIARIAKDADKMESVKRRIEWYNREMKSYKEPPTPEINARTLNQWEKGSGSDRMRQIARYYYE